MFSLMILPLVAALSSNINGVSAMEELNDANLDSQTRFVIKNLDKTQFTSARKGWSHDYGLKNKTGLLNTFEHLRSLVSFQALQYALPMDIYLEGPHSKSELNLNSKFTFGHYNPEFVDHLDSVLSRVVNDETFVNSTRTLMTDYGILNNLKKLQEIYLVIQDDPDSFKKYKQLYQEMLENKSWPTESYDGYRNYLPKYLDKDYYWNWSETMYYFWIRRDIDGTIEQWISVIDTVVDAYEN